MELLMLAYKLGMKNACGLSGKKHGKHSSNQKKIIVSCQVVQVQPGHRTVLTVETRYKCI